MRSFFALALCLSLIALSPGRVSARHAVRRNAEPDTAEGIIRWIVRLFKRLEPRQDRPLPEACILDDWYTFVRNASIGEKTCKALIDYDGITITTDYTPTSTFYDITTRVVTDDELIRTTPKTTVTKTVTPMAKRNAQITPMARDLSAIQLRAIADLFRRQASDNSSTTLDDAAISASLVSACSCQTYAGSTVIETYTDEPTITTVPGFVKVTTTVYSTSHAGALTSTVTVTASPATGQAALPSGNDTTPAPGTGSSAGGSLYAQTTGFNQTGLVSQEFPSASSFAPVAKPTAPMIRCPDDDGTTVHQLVGNERFDYDIYCSYDLPGSVTIYDQLGYSTFSECIAACSVVDGDRDQPDCQGVVFYDVPRTVGHNCFLKSTANSSELVPALSMDVAILKTIAVGITNSKPNGTSTESIPFTGPTSTVAPSELSGSISTLLANRTTSMAVNPPPGNAAVSGRLAPGYTAYSTYISDGSTFSTRSDFTTYYTSNGSWYEYYTYTWYAAWSSATTVYAAGASGYAIEYNNTDTSKNNLGNNGDYTVMTDTNSTTIYYLGNSTVYNTTEVIKSTLYSASNVALNVSATTYFFTYTEASAQGNGNGNGAGANGGGEGGASGLVSGPVSSTISIYSTHTVSFISGITSGASGYQVSGAIATPAPTVPSTSVFSTQFVSSNGGNTNGAGGGGASGAIPSPFVIVNSDATSGAGGSGASGLVTPSSSLSSAAVVTSTSVTVVLVSSAISGAGGSAASAIIWQTVVSGETSGSGGSTASGLITPLATPSGVIIVNATSGAVSGGGEGGASGPVTPLGTPSGIILVNATSGAVSGAGGSAASGLITPVTPPSGGISVNATSGAVSGAGGSAASGLITPLPTPFSTTLVSIASEIKTGGGGSAASGLVTPPLSHFSNTGALRSGTDSTSSTSATITGPVLYPPLSASSEVSRDTDSNGSTRSSTGGRFSNTGAPRSGTVPSSSRTSSRSPSATGPVPYPPVETMPSSVASLSRPIVTGPVPYIPASSSSVALSTGPRIPSSSERVTIKISTGSAASPTGGRFSNTGAPRSGTVTISSLVLPATGYIAHPPIETASTSIVPVTATISTPFGNLTTLSNTGPHLSLMTPMSSSCVYGNTSTTTMFVTTTVYGCYGFCQPANYGAAPYSAGPQSFGPPQAGEPSLTGTVPTPSSG